MALLMRDLVIGFVLMITIGIGLTSYLSEFTSEYGVSMDDNVTEVLSGLNETALDNTYVWSKGFQNRTQSDEGVSESAGEIVFSASLFQIIKLPFDLLGYVWDILQGIPRLLGIPSWAVQTLMLLTIIIVVLVVISPAFRKDT